MPSIIAILEDDENRIALMREQFGKIAFEYDLAFFDNAPDMLRWLRGNLNSVALLCLDHDLGPNRKRDGEVFDPGTGRDIVDYLITCPPTCPVLIHSTNSPAAEGMRFALDDAGWHNQRVIPLGDLEWIESEWSSKVATLLSI